MSRDIADSFVIDRIDELNIDRGVLSNPKYIGKVETKLKSVALNKSPVGLKTIDVTESLNNIFNAIKVNGDDPIIRMVKGEDGMDIPCTQNQLKMLKALAIEQVNYSEEYSRVVAQIFVQLFEQCAVGKVDCNFTMPVDASKLQSTIISHFGRYIKESIQEGN